MLEPDRVDLHALLLVLAEDADGLRMLDHVRSVARRAVHVDRSGHTTDEREGKVEEHPLDAGRGEDREGVALPHAECQEPGAGPAPPRGGPGPEGRPPPPLFSTREGR